MDNYKQTKPIKRKSPLNDLKESELKDLIAWQKENSYKLLEEVIMKGELIYSRDALLGGELKEKEFTRLSERFKTFRAVLNIPKIAEKLLKNEKKDSTAPKPIRTGV